MFARVIIGTLFVVFGASIIADAQTTPLWVERLQMEQAQRRQERQAQIQQLELQIARENICQHQDIKDQIISTFNSQSTFTKSHGRLKGLQNVTTERVLVPSNLLSCNGIFTLEDGTEENMTFTLPHIFMIQ